LTPRSDQLPDEIAEAHWIVEVCERFGTMRPEDADEWRRRIAGRRAFLGLEGSEVRVVARAGVGPHAPVT
jgi:hypothetical protein